MSFNKNTWSKDYTHARGIKLLGAEDAKRQGYAPKYSRKSAEAFAAAQKRAEDPKVG